MLDSTDAARIRRSRTRSTPTARCSSSPRSRAVRSSRYRCSRTSSHWSPTAQLRRDHRSRLGLEKLAGEHGFRRTFNGDPDIGGRYSALSAFGIVPAALMGIDVRALLAAQRGAWRPPDAEGLGRRDRARASRPPCLAGRRAERARAGRARQAHVRHLRVAAGPRPVAGAAGGRVDRQARYRHPAGRRGAAGRARRYGEDRVFAYLPDVGMRQTLSWSAVRALGEAGHPVITMPTRGPADLGRVFLLCRARRRRRRLGSSDQPVRPAERAAGEGRDQARARRLRSQGTSCPRSPTPTSGAARAARRRARRRSYVAIMGYYEPSAEFDAAVAELRVAIRAATRRRRPRSATARASCTRPASSTRAAQRPGASCS